jgi:hypothetical protein
MFIKLLFNNEGLKSGMTQPLYVGMVIKHGGFHPIAQDDHRKIYELIIKH